MEHFLFFVKGIPELAGSTAFALALGRVQLRWQWIVPVGAVITLSIYIVRMLPFTFGLHTLAGLLLLVFFLARFTRLPVSLSFLYAFLTIAMLAVLELVIHEALFALSGLQASEVLANPLLWHLFGLPQAAIMIILALLLARFRRPRMDMWRV